MADIEVRPEETVISVKVWARDACGQPSWYMVKYSYKRLTQTLHSFSIIKGRDRLEALKNFYVERDKHESKD